MTEHGTTLQNIQLLQGLDLDEESNLALSVLHRVNLDRFLSVHPGIAAIIVQYIARSLSLSRWCPHLSLIDSLEAF